MVFRDPEPNFSIMAQSLLLCEEEGRDPQTDPIHGLLFLH